jgi:hypothetical protein
LDDQEGSADVELLQGMVVVDQRKRLSAYSCLKKGLKNGLFRRRTVDGLVECAQTPEVPAAESASTLSSAEGNDSDATVIVA